MRNKMIIAVSLVVAGVMTYLMFSGLDEDFYHFPWKVFAGFGIMSWLVREGLKLVRDVKKEFEERRKGSSISLSACHSWYG
ncbi:alanine aminotransferase [Streptococcus pneumoniae]|nr:alanine aminotransferase [Streptococcus pneumoniae]